MHSLQVENGLSVAHASRFSHLHGEGLELQERVCPFPQVVEERRMEKGLGHDIEPSKSTPPPFVVGSAVAIKDARKGRRPMPYISRTDREYRLPCPLPLGSHNDVYNISEALSELFSRLIVKQNCF